MNLVEYLLLAGKPDKVALTTSAGSYTYADLHSAVNQMAALLRERGLEPGARVGLLGKNSLFWVSAYLGTVKLGGVCVPIPAHTTPECVSEIASWIKCRFICLGGEEEEHSPPTLDTDAVIHEVDFLRRLSAAAQTIPSADLDHRTTVASLMLTSGSTRRPRAVMVTHGNIISNTRSIVECLRLTEADRMLCLLPLSYCFGTSLLHTHLAVGGSIVLSGGMFQPATAFRLMQEERCTGFAGVPSVFQVLLRGGPNRRFVFPSCITKIQQAGGRLAAQLVTELRQAAPNADIFIMYGQTEATARLTCLPPGATLSKAGSVGRPVPGVTIRLLAPDGRIAEPGEVGEVVVEGENVTLGYWDAQELNDQVFRDGKLYTGDLGYFDKDGFLFLAGRTQDFIKSGGIRTSVGELEESVMRVPEVVEAAAVPVPDRLRGEAVRLFVVVSSDSTLTSSRILQHCRQSVSNHLVPREVIFLNELPKNASGKVLKAALTMPTMAQVAG